MNSSSSSVLDILYAVEPVGSVPRALMEKVVQIGEHRAVQRSITDWPFENFWGNPHEPLHSKLLRYFINPAEKHQCGSFLLKQFVAVLVSAIRTPHMFPDISGRDDVYWDNCCVVAETRFSPKDDQAGQLDILITSDGNDGNDGKFTIIVENKINRAPNQPKQLEKYVKEAARRDFRNDQIFVFFLPLTDDYEPKQEDLKAIEGKATYAEITFEQHIREWLAAVLGKRWPDNFPATIREHLSYYRNLIDYLINQRKTQIMSDKLLEQFGIIHLTQAEEDG